MVGSVEYRELPEADTVYIYKILLFTHHQVPETCEIFQYSYYLLTLIAAFP